MLQLKEVGLINSYKVPWVSRFFAWHILGDRLIPEQLLWVDRGILHVTH